MFFSDDGSTSVEVALKIAYQYWINVGEAGRRSLVAFDGGYHGDTLGAMSLGRGSQLFSAFRDLMCKVVVLPCPATFAGDDAAEEREAGALSAFEALLADRGHTIAALIIEPLLQGAGGMRLCRPSFLKRLVKLARDARVLVIFDEVATGFGRTGTMFAMEQADIVPDLVCLSKGLTAGYMPMAVTVAREPIFEAFLGESFERALPHGHSFTANPLACAVALASLQLFKEENTLERIARINRRHREFMGELAARPDVSRLRVIGSILAFDVNAGGGYQSWESRALRNWFLAHGLNIRPLGQTIYLHAALLHHRRGVGPRLCRHRRVLGCAGVGRAEQPIDDMPGDAAAMRGIGCADGAAERAWRQRRVALFWRQSSDRLHAAEEGERVGIGRQALFLDNPRKRLDLGKPAGQALAREHAAPLGEAVGAERRVKQDSAGGEQPPQALEARDRVGKPMQRHARDDEVEIGMASSLARIHHLETDARLIRSRKIAPAFGNHGRRHVGQHEASFRVARKQMAAEQAGAAPQLEHVRLLALGQEARQPVGDRALKPGMTLVAFGASAEACGDFRATTGEHWRIRGHDARTSVGASGAGHGPRPVTR